MSAFYDLFVGASSFTAGLVANSFGYAAAFVMAIVALGAAAIAGRFVFVDKESVPAHAMAGAFEELVVEKED